MRTKQATATMTLKDVTIRLENMRLNAHHGVMPQERIVGGSFTVNATLRLKTDVAETACRTDNLEATVNYAEVYAALREEMLQPSQLLEHACWRMLRRLLQDFPLITAATISLRKDTPPMGADCEGCSVTLTAER